MKKWIYTIGTTYVEFLKDDMHLYLEPISQNIVRCIYAQKEAKTNTSIIINRKVKEKQTFSTQIKGDWFLLKLEKLVVEVNINNAVIVWKDAKGNILLREAGREISEIDVMKYTTGEEEPIIERVKTVDGERNFIKNLKEVKDHTAYRGKLYFDWKETEGIYGLGQAEEGIYNYRGQNQYLYQHNMRIPMPMFQSDQGYGMLFDCCSLITFNDDKNGSYIFLDTIKQLDYYFVAGETPNDVVAGFRSLTGDAVMLPKWAFGYIQSKEQYYSAQELLDTVKHYRKLQVPIDCVVQDWNTWEPGNWGEKIVDKKRYGDLKECMDEIHKLHAHSMVSIWPNMNSGGKNHTQLFNAGYMLNDYSTYNAFSKEAREMYWNQAKEELFAGGFDSWWCDSTEPFSGPDWGGAVKREPWERFVMVGGEHKKYLDSESANVFALMHAKGIYENQRNETNDIRVLNLTRSGYASGQKYAAMLWSGDTCASWQTLRQQIVEGLNMGLSGYPYWTLDIGGFFTVGSEWKNRGCGCSTDAAPKWFWQGKYNDGVKDAGYKELYVRWLQMGTFLPMFRSHGTDTPREIWNFGKKGDMFYDAIEKFIKLRYRLMPYIYSMAGEVVQKGTVMMKSLLFNYKSDSRARSRSDEFMFGDSLLICPVIEPMYYEAENRELNREKTRSCYLPEGNDWYDYWDNKQYAGGTEVVAAAEIDRIPIFVKAGSILPMQEGLQYACEQNGEPLELYIYTGADADFELYEDEGNNYNYEKGDYSITGLHWNEKEQSLTLDERSGSYAGMTESRNIMIYKNGEKYKECNYEGKRIIL